MQNLYFCVSWFQKTLVAKSLDAISQSVAFYLRRLCNLLIELCAHPAPDASISCCANKIVQKISFIAHMPFLHQFPLFVGEKINKRNESELKSLCCPAYNYTIISFFIWHHQELRHINALLFKNVIFTPLH